MNNLARVTEEVYYPEELRKRSSLREDSLKKELHSGKKEARSSPLAFFLFSSILICALILGYVIQHAMITQNAFYIDDLKSNLREINIEKAKVQVDIENLQNEQRIQEIATKKLGMVSPQKVTYIDLSIPTKPTYKEVALLNSPKKDKD